MMTLDLDAGRDGTRRPTPDVVRLVIGPVRRMSLGLRARLAVLVIVASLPALLLYLHHAQQERRHLVAEAESRAMRLALAWAENHDALVRETHLLLLAAAREAGATGDEDA